MMQCSSCKEFFNPAMLSEVFEHEHSGIATDKEYFGVEVKDCIHSVKQCGSCSNTGCPERNS